MGGKGSISALDYRENLSLLKMGEFNMKTSCLYLCLVFLSILILITSFTIQWIMNSVQFGLVSGTGRQKTAILTMV